MKYDKLRSFKIVFCIDIADRNVTDILSIFHINEYSYGILSKQISELN